MTALAVATTFLGLAMLAVAILGSGITRDWMGYCGMAIAAVGFIALAHYG